MPREVSQSHASVPSRSIARIWNPPPGITTTATPVLFPCGAYTVIVGRVTLVTAVTGRPPIRSFEFIVTVSGPGTGFRSGATPGQIGICVCPVDGSQSAAFACTLVHATSSPRAMIQSFMTRILCGAWPRLRIQDRAVGELRPAHTERYIGVAAACLVAFF
jgi:hypothetical protein